MLHFCRLSVSETTLKSFTLYYLLQISFEGLGTNKVMFNHLYQTRNNLTRKCYVLIYIQFEFSWSTLNEYFYRTYKEVKQEAARCIGAVGTVLEGDNERLVNKLN